MKEAILISKNSTLEKLKNLPITTKSNSQTPPNAKNIDLKEISQIDFDIETRYLGGEDFSYCLENTKSLKFELREVNEKNQKLEDVNTKLRKRVDKLMKRLKGNEEFMQLLRSEMMEVHKENKMLNSQNLGLKENGSEKDMGKGDLDGVRILLERG